MRSPRNLPFNASSAAESIRGLGLTCVAIALLPFCLRDLAAEQWAGGRSKIVRTAFTAEKGRELLPSDPRRQRPKQASGLDGDLRTGLGQAVEDSGELI